MTYTSGGLIQATDYNGFVSTTAGANINDIWGTGTGDKGWGQTALGTVSAAGTVTATQWASLVNTLTSMGSQTNTTLTARTAPTAGQTISILSNVATDLTSVTANRGNAAASGTTSSTWTGSTARTATTGGGDADWTLTWTQTVTFASADAARYFFNAGGLIRLDMSKTSTGTDKDADWNTFVATVGTLYFSGRVNSAAQTIAGTSYTGFTRVGGSGTPSPNLTTTGFYSLTPGAAATTMWQLNSTVSPYSGDFIRIQASVDSGSSQITFTTTWFSDGLSGAGRTNNISGGTDTASPYTSFGTAPAVLCRFIPPSTTNLTASWGTPVVASAVSTSGYSAAYVIVAGGGGGGIPGGGFDPASSGGGGAGGYLEGSTLFIPTTVYSVTVGAGGSGSSPANGANSTALGLTATGGGKGGNGDSSSGTSGSSGGSGGGGGYANKGGGAGTLGQGQAGGSSTLTPGGGGGALNSGGTPNGGDGKASTITGSSVTYAGGGAGGGGTGGAGGGGNSSGGAGTANTGGGGAGVNGSSGSGGNGGSGVVIFSVPTANYTGTTTGSPTVTTSGSNTIIKFTASGSYTA